MRKILPAFAVGLLGTSGICFGAETVSYQYDALGRLVASSTSGGPDSGVATGTSFDPAGNRSQYTVTGAATARRDQAPVNTISERKVEQR